MTPTPLDRILQNRSKTLPAEIHGVLLVVLSMGRSDANERVWRLKNVEEVEDRRNWRRGYIYAALEKAQEMQELERVDWESDARVLIITLNE